MAHALGKLGPSFLREGVMLPVEPFIPKLNPTRHKTPFLEFLEGRVYRPGLGLPVTREPFFEFSDHLISVHRLLRQEEEQPKGAGSHFHPPRRGARHPLTRPGANALGLICVNMLPKPKSPNSAARLIYLD